MQKVRRTKAGIKLTGITEALKNKTRLELLVASLDIVDTEPTEAFLRVSEFATLAETNTSTVTAAITRGVIDHRRCVAIPMQTGKLRILVDWNAAGYDYILSRAKQYWPKDFKINKAKKYRPIKVTKKATLTQAPKTVEKPKSIENIYTLQEAKLETEKLKILELQVAHQVANNEALLVDDVMQIAQSLAFAVKSQLRRFITLSSPKLMRCKTVVEVRSIQEACMQDVLAELEPMTVETTYTGETKENKNE